MEVEKLFNELESNQVLESDEAKKTIVETFVQTKETWLVHGMLDYYLKTGSLRIMEVLVRAQSPHDVYIFDKLDEWLRGTTHRVQALNIFGFIIRKHPTWLFKVEKHKLIRNILRLLQTEKEIVSLMSALLCMITLLPIIPNLVPNFLSDLFDVFGHLACWNCQNPNKLPDDKLVHLQLGLQMLFHRLYGMYPCNFFAYITEFTKKEKGAIFQHTIKPLLESVRVHPLLVTATIETEVSPSRWKEVEPHDVVVQCAKLSLPVQHQELLAENPSNGLSSLQDTPISINSAYINPITSQDNAFSFCDKNITVSPFQPLIGCEQFSQCQNSSSIWSPSTEITTCAIPLTPTPSYIFPLSNSGTTPSMGVTGSSPPEAAIEATPETTPLKDTSVKRSSNPHAVRAILISSQPSSPMRKESSHFNFPETSPNHLHQQSNVVEQPIRAPKTTPGTLHERMVQQMLNDRNHPQSPQVKLFEETHKEHHHRNLFNTPPLISSDICDDLGDQNDTESSGNTNSTIIENIGKICDNCDETERSMCSAGGLHIPTTKSMQMLAKGIKRNRVTSYNSEYARCEKASTDESQHENVKVRRTKSCSAIAAIKYDDEIGKTYFSKNSKHLIALKVPSDVQVLKKQQPCTTITTTSVTQTVQTWPQFYEFNLYDLFFEGNKLRNSYECNLLYPQEILNQYVDRTIKTKDSIDAAYPIDQETHQLLCLQLQYERYRREIHAERNRRLMGRSRDKRSLEMERNRLRDQLKCYSNKNKELMMQIDKSTKLAKERQQKHAEELSAFKSKYLLELERSKNLRLANESLQAHLNEEMASRKDATYELEMLRGDIFDMKTEFQHAQMQADLGMQCKQELAHLEAEFVIMGEVQIKCRDKLAELDNFKARDHELLQLQDTYNMEVKELKTQMETKSYHFETTKSKLADLQMQLGNNEKVFAEQKRLLKTVKDEYEEKLKALDNKYKHQKSIIIQMEEEILSLRMSLGTVHGSPNSSLPVRLSPSITTGEGNVLANSQSIELRNIHRLAEQVRNITGVPESAIQTGAIHNSFNNNAESRRIPVLDVNPFASISSSSASMPSTNQLNTQSISCDTTGSILINNPTHTTDMPVPEASTSHHHFHNPHQQHQSSCRHNQYPPRR